MNQGWEPSASGRARQRTEYWLMYERADGTVRRWQVFLSQEVAEGAIPDAKNCTPAKRWGVKTVEVTQYVIENTQWKEG